MSWTIRKLPWLLLAIVALATFLRLFCLGCESFKSDEAFSVLWSTLDPVTIIKSTAPVDPHPPFYYLLLHYWMVLFGESETAVRALSACLGIVSVLVFYRIGCELLNKKIALIASFLMAINAFVITHSQEARQYSLLLFLTLVSFLFFIRMLEAEKIKKSYVLIYLITNVILCYTHLFGIFTIGSQVLYFLLFRHRFTGVRFVFWGTQALTLLLFAPWIFVLVTDSLPYVADTDIFLWIPEPTIGWVAEIIASISGPQYLWLPVAYIFVLVTFALFLAGALIPSALSKNERQNRVRGSNTLTRILKTVAEPRTSLLLLWFIIPIILALILSATVRPIFLNRYLIGTVPALYLLAAIGIYKIDSLTGGYLLRVKAACLIVVLVTAITAQGLYTYYAMPQKPEWREVTSLIECNARPDDGIIVYKEGFRRPFYYYYLENPEISVETHEVIGTEPSWIDKDRVWLVFASMDPDEDISLRNDLVAQYGKGTPILQEEFHLITVYLFDQ